MLQDESVVRDTKLPVIFHRGRFEVCMNSRTLTILCIDKFVPLGTNTLYRKRSIHRLCMYGDSLNHGVQPKPSIDRNVDIGSIYIPWGTKFPMILKHAWSSSNDIDTRRSTFTISLFTASINMENM